MAGTSVRRTRAKDLTGRRFGQLTAISSTDERHNSNIVWLCRCECGRIAKCSSNYLLMGHSTNCGCQPKAREVKHGHARGDRHSCEYSTWASMRQRCLNPKNPKFQSYGGRGITVCDRWKHFEPFLEDMGPRPDGMSLDRINNDGHYEPGNCRWATPKQQLRNTRQTPVVTFNGVTGSLADLAERQGLTRETVRGRINRGWSIERALSVPQVDRLHAGTAKSDG